MEHFDDGVLLLTLLSQRRLGPRLACALEGGSKHMCPVVDLREWCGAEVTHLLGGRVPWPWVPNAGKL